MNWDKFQSFLIFFAMGILASTMLIWAVTVDDLSDIWPHTVRVMYWISLAIIWISIVISFVRLFIRIYKRYKG